MRKTASIWLVLPLIATALAGCTHSPQMLDLDDPAAALAPDEGAISGLLVDDRFRPVAAGSILLQEIGEQVATNSNGEFRFVGLAPGSYTIRVVADGHEASPQSARVEAGQFHELSIVARRIVEDAGAIITNEHSVFIGCAVDIIVTGFSLPCEMDRSGEAYSASYSTDLTATADVSYVITEFIANQESGYHVQIRGDAGRYATAIWNGDRVRIAMETGATQTEWEEAERYSANVPFENDEPFSTIFFVEHDLLRDLSPACCGLGVTLGVKGQFVQSVFIGPPEQRIDTYCALC